ncbi:hypothetical protein HTS61_18420 [Escherichia coli]|nr:hypothetical protein [Escherichia coli]
MHGINPERLTIELSDADGNITLSYQEHQPQELPLPDVAKAPLAAQDITSTDEARVYRSASGAISSRQPFTVRLLPARRGAGSAGLSL